MALQLPFDAPPVRSLNEFDLDGELEAHLDGRPEVMRACWPAWAGLDDDTLPAVAPHFGIAKYSAWLGMEVRLQESTCSPVPILQEPRDLERLKPDPETPWFRLLKRAYDHLRKRRNGEFFLSVRGAMTLMDLANAVRGDELFTDSRGAPGFVHALMERLTGLERSSYVRLYSWCHEVDGGQLHEVGQVWMAIPSLGHISNDAATLCSPAVCAESGAP